VTRYTLSPQAYDLALRELNARYGEAGFSIVAWLFGLGWYPSNARLYRKRDLRA